MAMLADERLRHRFHPVQWAYWNSPYRFNVVPAGRRSGKTAIAKRRLIRKALRGNATGDGRYFAAAPVNDQARRIFWADLKAMAPVELMSKKPNETHMIISLINGSEIHVFGLDKPARMEGSPWDHGCLDEIANMKPEAWVANVRPALSDRLGTADLIGVPEGRNHYYDLYKNALAEMAERGPLSEWGAFHWKSIEILGEKEVESARRDMDPLTFEQEYEASFVNFEGRAYYPFLEATHCAPRLRERYNPMAPLVFCFDFNVAPGVAAVCQEMRLPWMPQDHPKTGTGVIGEVHIPQNSNTPAVCRKLVQDWGKHMGPVFCYGDATGGASGSAKVAGSDWDLIRAGLKPTFGERLNFRVPAANPHERPRINAVNTRLKNGAGEIFLQVDPHAAPNVVKDLEGVRLLLGGSGELDKKIDPKLTHISDALGYYVVFEFPIDYRRAATSRPGSIMAR